MIEINDMSQPVAAVSLKKPYESTDSFVIKALLSDKLKIHNSPAAKPLLCQAAVLVSATGKLKKEMDNLINLKPLREQNAAYIAMLGALGPSKKREADNFAQQLLLTDEKLHQHYAKRETLTSNARENKISLVTELKAIFEKLRNSANPQDVSGSLDVLNIIKRNQAEGKKNDHELRKLLKEVEKLNFELTDLYKRILPELPPEKQQALASQAPKMGSAF